MAGITNNGTVNNLPDYQKPSDYTDPTVVTTGAWLCKYRTDLELSLLKVTIDESDAATTMAAIISNATIGISKQALDLVTADFDVAGRTVVFYTKWKGFKTNMTALGKADPILTDAVTNYVCTVDIFVRVSA